MTTDGGLALLPITYRMKYYIIQPLAYPSKFTETKAATIFVGAEFKVDLSLVDYVKA